MKKMLVAIMLGMVMMFGFCGCSETNYELTTEEKNETMLEFAHIAVEEDLGLEEYELVPKSTIDGVVQSYNVIVDGEVIGVVESR